NVGRQALRIARADREALAASAGAVADVRAAGDRGGGRAPPGHAGRGPRGDVGVAGLLRADRAVGVLPAGAAAVALAVGAAGGDAGVGAHSARVAVAAGRVLAHAGRRGQRAAAAGAGAGALAADAVHAEVRQALARRRAGLAVQLGAAAPVHAGAARV